MPSASSTSPATLVEKSSDQSYAFVEKLWAMRRIGEIIDELDLKGKNDELITELVTLSTKHGILTQYTSFLADENAPAQQLADLRGNTELTAPVTGTAGRDRRPGGRGPAGGQELASARRAGFGSAQRRVRCRRSPAAVPRAAVPRAAPGGARWRGRRRAGGYGFGARASNFYRDAATDKEVEAKGIQVAGNETLYKRGKCGSPNAQKIDPEKDADKIKRVKRFSDDYFELVRDNSADENAVLAAQQEGEELLLVLRGQAYCIE